MAVKTNFVKSTVQTLQHLGGVNCSEAVFVIEQALATGEGKSMITYFLWHMTQLQCFLNRFVK